MTEEAPIYTAPEEEHILDALTREEQLVLEFYRSLDEAGRQAVWEIMRLVYAARREAQSTEETSP
jgi:hypothetical protein